MLGNKLSEWIMQSHTLGLFAWTFFQSIIIDGNFELEKWLHELNSAWELASEAFKAHRNNFYCSFKPLYKYTNLKHKRCGAVIKLMSRINYKNASSNN